MITNLLQNNPLNTLALIAALAPQEVADRLSSLGIYVAPNEDSVYQELVKLAKKKDKTSLEFILYGLHIPADDLNDETKTFFKTVFGAEEKEAVYTTKEADTDNNDSSSNDSNNSGNNNSGNNSNSWLELGVGVTGFLTSLFSFLSAKNNPTTNNQTSDNSSSDKKSGTNWLVIGAIISGVLMIGLILLLVLKK